MIKKVKEIKNKKIKKHSSIQSVKNEYTNMLQIVGLVFGIFILFFVITTLVTKKTTTTNNIETTIQYDNILVGEITKQTPTEYYVLATDSKDSNDLYKLYLSYYEQKDNNLKTYFVNLDDGFNSGYVAEKSNVFVSDLSQIRFKDATLLHIKNNKIDICYEGKEQIVIQFENLIK